MKHIDQIPDFKALADPLHNLRCEIAANKQEEEALQVELSQLRTSAADSGENAWESYLRDQPDALARRDELRAKIAKLQARDRSLEEALEAGQNDVKRLSSCLSKQPCQQARPLVAVEIKTIHAALDQITEANQKVAGGSELLV